MTMPGGAGIAVSTPPGARLPCWRVAVSRGEQSMAPIINAASEAEARSRAAVLGDMVLRRRRPLPWVAADWHEAKPPDTAPVSVERPVLLHRVGAHP